jgi:hypothetical protein
MARFLVFSIFFEKAHYLPNLQGAVPARSIRLKHSAKGDFQPRSRYIQRFFVGLSESPLTA